MIFRYLTYIVETVIISLVVLLLIIFGVVDYQAKHIDHLASPLRFTQYKPTKESTMAFDDFKAENPEVFSWLTIPGTGIDYPVVQGIDNDKYVHTDALGGYSMTGAIFLDSNNKQDFSDFSSIIYGHHMAASLMFGDVGRYINQTYLDEHPFGRIWVNGEEKGIEFYGLMVVDSHNTNIYNVYEKSLEDREAYIELVNAGLKTKAEDVSLSASDNLVLLSTCTHETNKRHVLVGRLVPAYPYPAEVVDDEAKINPVIILLPVILITVVIFIRKRGKQYE